MTKFQYFQKIFTAMSAQQQIEMFNTYCEHIKDLPSRIYPFNEETLNEILSSKKPWELIAMGTRSDIYWYDEYFNMDETGRIRTFCNPLFRMDLDAMYDYEGCWLEDLKKKIKKFKEDEAD